MGITLPALAALLLGAGPVIQTVEDGSIDWSNGEARVLGVGTPRILSATGSITAFDPFLKADQDARERLGRVLKALPLDASGRVGNTPDLAEAADRFALEAPLRKPTAFSDGTVHQRGNGDILWLVGTIKTSHWQGPLQVVPTVTPAEAVLIVVDGSLPPALRMTTEDGSGAYRFSLGLPGDLLGGDGISWHHTEDAALQMLGSPSQVLRVVAQPSKSGAPGALVVEQPGLEALMAAALQPRPPSRLAVVFRSPKP